MLPQKVDVAIVGAGPVGLFLKGLLQNMGVSSIVLEHQKAPTRHPQAHFINTRTMEILKHSLPAVEKAIRIASPPRDEWRSFVWCTRLVGGRCLAAKDMLDVGGDVDNVSPVQASNLAQHKLQRILLDHVSLLEPKCVRYGHTVESLSSNMSSVTVRGAISAREDNISTERESSTFSVDAKYVVGADGVHSTIRRLAGIRDDEEWTKDYSRLINVHFQCTQLAKKLSAEDTKSLRRAMLYFVYCTRGIAVFVAHDIEKGDWVCQIPCLRTQRSWAESLAKDYSLAAEEVSKMVGLDPDSIEVLSVRPWTMRTRIADQYVSDCGRIILAGDAAHSFPPAGGFGMNTGLQDAFNLAWKLSIVLDGEGSSSMALHKASQFLRSYSLERKPVAVSASVLSDENYSKTLKAASSLGLDMRMAKILETFVDYVVPSSYKSSVTSFAMKVGLFPLVSLEGPVGQTHYSRIFSLFLKPWAAWCQNSLTRLIFAHDGSLPLLFPRFVLGHAYSEGAILASDRSTSNSGHCGSTSLTVEETSYKLAWGSGDMQYISALVVGARMPHIFLQAPSSDVFSSVDLPAQLQLRQNTQCPWVVFLVSAGTRSTNLLHALNRLQEHLLLNTACVEITCSSIDVGVKLQSKEDWSSNILKMKVRQHHGSLVTWKSLAVQEGIDVVLLRPDGCIAWVLEETNDLDEALLTQALTRCGVFRP